MTQAAIPFLQLLHNEAKQNGYISIDIPHQQGVVVLPQDCSPHEQIDLLQQFLVKLRTALPTQPIQEHPASADMDCQVTVEERTQLFKFLQS